MSRIVVAPVADQDSVQAPQDTGLLRLWGLSTVLCWAVSEHLLRNICVMAVVFNKEIVPVEKLITDGVRESVSKPYIREPAATAPE